MSNHLHIIMHFESDGFNLNKIIADGKRFMAYEIINGLKNKGNLGMLNKLSSLVTIREKKKGKLHKMFKDSFDPKPIINNPFLLQKINYIHNNLDTGKWMLAKDFTECKHSSASFYELNSLRHFLPIHLMDI